jgi:BTB/POZ domain
MSVNSYVDIVLVSGSQLHRNCIQWKLYNFSTYLSEWLYFPIEEWILDTPKYSTNSGKTWDLTINFCTESFEMEIFFNLVSSKKDDISFGPVCIHTELSLIVDGNKHQTQQRTIESTESECIWKMKIKDLKKFMTKNLKNGTLCINLEVEEANIVTNFQNDGNAKCLPIGNTIINFLNNQNFTDVTLQCQDKEFKAHKLVLAAASPVFNAMFKEGTKEQRDSHVNIEDVNSDIFDVFLRFLYSGEVDHLAEMCFDLFAAADKYDVQPLRDICIRHMAENITVDNAVDFLALAERHTIEPTKSLALKFIQVNFADVPPIRGLHFLLITMES